MSEMQKDAAAANAKTDAMDKSSGKLVLAAAEGKEVTKEKNKDITEQLEYDTRVADANANFNYKNADRKEEEILSKEAYRK